MLKLENISTPGIYTGLSNKDYQQHGAVGSTSLKTVIYKSSAHLKYGIKKEATAGMELGTAIHTAILEPDMFPQQYVVGLDLPKRKNADKEAHADFKLEHAGKTIITKDQKIIIDGCAASVLRHPKAKRLLSKGVAEQSIFWKMEGVDCKCRPDYTTMIADMPVFVDLKTTADASPKGFQKAIVNFGYHISAAYYIEGGSKSGICPENFIFIAVEKEPPYAVGIYRATHEMLAEGRELFLKAIEMIAKCQATGNWIGYSEEILDIDLPAWAYRK